MKKIDTLDIKKYEAMAKLDLPETERQWLSGRINELLESFSGLEDIDTAGISPLVTVLDIQNVLRDDVVKKMITREELLSNMPEQENTSPLFEGFFQVPKTFA